MRVLFVSRSKKDGDVPPIIKRQGESLEKFGISIDYYLIENNGFRSYLKAIFDLRKLIRKNEYSLGHVHYGLAGMTLLLTFTRLKKVLSLMGSEVLASNDNGEGFKKSEIILTRIIKRTLKYYDGIIVKSHRMKNILPKVSVEVIPNGVDLDAFKPMERAISREKLSLKMDELVFLFPSNKNRKVKNFRLFEEAIELIEEEYNKVKIIWFDNIPHEETVYYFNAANVVVLTSLHEGSPNVIKEAMACNIPIVSVDVGDVAQIIKNTDGCYVSDHNAKAIADKLRKAIVVERTQGRNKIDYLDSKTIAKKIIIKYNKILDC